MIVDNKHPPFALAYRRRYRKKSPEYSKYETIKDSVKAVGKEYCSESSICGLKHLVNDNTTRLERIIWVIILISALICSASLVWFTFRKYYKAPLVTTQMPQGVSVSTIIFPAVGICSNNRISKRAVTELAEKLLKEERNKKYSKTEMTSLLFGLGQLYNLQGLSEDNMRAKQLHIALGDYDVIELMRNLTPHCDDLLLRCAWNEKPEDCSHLFNFRLTVNGFCCTFNYLRPSDIFEDRNSDQRSLDMYKYGNKSSFDFDMGLKVLLKIDDSDDFFYNIPSLGSTLQFSDAYDFPDGPSGSFSMQIISPDVQMTVSVAASFTEASRDIQHVSVKLRSCLFYDESSYLPFYTHSDCMLKCRMLFLLQKCNCTPFNMPKMRDARTCDMQDLPCLRIYYASFTEASGDIQHVSVKLRSCLFYDESSYLPFYTHSDCMLKCRMLFLLQNCNCTPFNMPKMNNARTYDMQDITCLGIYYAQSITVRPEVDEIPAELELDKVGGGIPCPMCYPTCSKTMYNFDFNNVIIYPNYLNSVPDEDREDWLYQSSLQHNATRPTFTEVSSTVFVFTTIATYELSAACKYGIGMSCSACFRVGANYTGASIVHVKYAKEVADCYGQNVIMKWFDLISNIGSTCGFVTGFSFVSVLEFFYFFTVKLFREIHQRQQRRKHRDHSAIQPPLPHLKPITRYRPIYWNELGNNVQKNY